MTAVANFLVEIGTEELPPKALRRLSDAFGDEITAGLAEAGLAFDDVTAFATPRRLALHVRDLATRQPDRETQMRGPPLRIAFDDDGHPTKAAEAFAGKCGVAVDQLAKLETDKGAWLVHHATETGQDAAALLPGIVVHALEKLPAPKRMRWGDCDTEFVRPVHWVVMLLGTDVVPADILGIAAGRSTRGHRFHAPASFDLASADDYADVLASQGFVVASFDERRGQVVEIVTTAAAGLDGEAVGDDALFDEVTALVEWPVPVSAGFDAKFLELPDEVLIETLQAHQRYFPVRGADGKLLANFITVSNIDSREPDQVREGNERVVVPRLADAAFFYDADRRTPLAERLAALDAVVFQKKLGSLHDKTGRVAQIAGWLAERTGADPALAERAARLAKCDLLTEMVGEFPSLQGTMGQYYALHDGEPAEVAAAIEQQYWPRFAGDHLPAGATGQAVAIAEKIDTIAGIFSIGQKPSGTRDPFGLRRSALGVLRILIERGLDVDLVELTRFAAKLQPGDSDDALVDEIYQYFLDRLRGYYLDGDIAGVSAQVFDAVSSRRPGTPLDFHARIHAVRDFAALEAATALAAANKRIANILRSAEDDIPDAPQADALTEASEKALYDHLQQARDEALPLIDARDYSAALNRLAQLRPAVDKFFDDVMVMCEDAAVRRNRLALLGQMRELFLRIADVSRLQVG